jgi:hypothetical protein
VHAVSRGPDTGCVGADWFAEEPQALNSAAAKGTATAPIVSRGAFILRNVLLNRGAQGRADPYGRAGCGGLSPRRSPTEVSTVVPSTGRYAFPMNDAPADRDHGEEEGWYLDPYKIHQQRWISKGRPSDLVRDGEHEGKDAPPDRPPSLPLVPAPVDGSLGWRDTRRADDASSQPIPDAGSYGVVAMDATVLFDNSLVSGPGPSGDRTGKMFETPFQRRMRQRARKKRWTGRWHGVFGPKS